MLMGWAAAILVATEQASGGDGGWSGERIDAAGPAGRMVLPRVGEGSAKDAPDWFEGATSRRLG